MKNYNLEEDEVVLYKGIITKSEKNYDLILTNNNIVFASENAPEIYPTKDVKIYKGEPQVKTKGNRVEIYLKSGEQEFTFQSKLEPYKFLTIIKKLLTGKSAYERSLIGIRNVINITKENLGEEISAIANVVTLNKLKGTMKLPRLKNKKN